MILEFLTRLVKKIIQNLQSKYKLVNLAIPKAYFKFKIELFKNLQ